MKAPNAISREFRTSSTDLDRDLRCNITIQLCNYQLDRLVTDLRFPLATNVDNLPAYAQLKEDIR